MTDLISRQAAIDAVRSYYDEEYALTDSIEELIEKLPSAGPSLDEWCTDCKEYDQEKHNCPRFNRVIRKALTEAEPVRKGRWEWIGGYGYQYRCSECIMCAERRTKYCPSCGAKMEEVSE